MSYSTSQQDLQYARQYLQACTSDVDLLERSELPSRWKEIRYGWRRTPIASRVGSVVSLDGLNIAFRYSPSQSIVFANHRVPLRCDLYYFEVKITNAELDGSRAIYLGFLPSLYVPSSPREMCLCSDLKVGDVIGCGISYLQSTIFIMRNGELESQVNQLPISWTVYPAVCAEEGLQLTSNFGQAIFRADVFGILDSIRVDLELTFAQGFPAKLPNELHIEILRHVTTLDHDDQSGRNHNPLEHDAETLKACSAVCTAWNRVFRPFSSTKIQLRCRESTRQLSSLSPSFAEHIRVLTLSSRIDTDHPWIHTLLVSPAAKMSSLRELSWDPTGCGAAKGEDPLAGCPPRLKTALPALMRGFASVEVLKIRGHGLRSFMDLARLVCSLPRLRELYMTEVNWNLPEAVDSPPQWLRRPRSLQYLSIKHGVDRSRFYVRGLDLVVSLWLFMIPPRCSVPSPVCASSCLRLDADDIRLLLCVTHHLLELLELKLMSAQAWHPYLEMIPDDDTRDAWTLRIHPRWIMEVIEYKFTSYPSENRITASKSCQRHVLASITLPAQLLSTHKLSNYEELAHPFLRKLDVVVPRLSNWPVTKSCVVELRAYSTLDMNNVVDDIASRVLEAMPDIRASGKLRTLKSSSGTERWRQDMQLCIRLTTSTSSS